MFSFGKQKKSGTTKSAGERPAAGVGRSNAEMQERLARKQAEPEWNGLVRGADEIRESGALEQFKGLEGVRVPASELDRTIEDDAIIVKQGFAKLSPEEIAEKKEAAYHHPEVATELEDAIKLKHYGGERHRKFGELVEKLTGGLLSAEEAMAMYPCGGIPGPGGKEIPKFLSQEGGIARHAMRHDATGFLLTRFGVGPGYGSKTTALGRQKDDPYAGQVLGILREHLTPSAIPEGKRAASPGRFNKRGGNAESL